MSTTTTTRTIAPTIGHNDKLGPNGGDPMSSLRTSLARDGYILIPSILSGTELVSLRTASQHATTLARSGKWPYIRTLPKQFPPWPSDPSSGIWGVQHLLHPSLPFQEAFPQSYFNPRIISTVTEILKCSVDDLVMELYNLLVRPDADFELRWHRDDIPPSASPEEEERRLEEPILHAQWNLALFDDESLVVVPGSHARARTEIERNADPYQESLPGMQAVNMRAGDVVFYDNNVLHRGIYSADKERMTLHGSMGMAKADPDRARNVLQHGVGEWVRDCQFGGLSGEVQGRRMGEVAEEMKRKLIAMGSGRQVGYSQLDT